MKYRKIPKDLTGVTLRGDSCLFETLKSIQEGLKISEISKIRKVSRKNVYKTLSSLIKKGLVRKIDYAAYELTSKGIQGLHSLVGSRYNLRQHNLHFKIEVLESPKNWAYKRQELRFLPYYNKTLKLRNNEQDYFNYGNLQIKTTTKSIIIKMPTIYAKGWETALIQAMNILEEKLPQIEKMFSIRLIKAFKSNITIISNEYAKLQDAIAKLYHKDGNRVYITGEDGKIWLITDFSFSTDELEFIHNDKATDDLDAVTPFFNDLRKNPTTLTEVREEMKEANHLILSHTYNIAKHQEVLDDILTEFREFKKWRENYKP